MGARRKPRRRHVLAAAALALGACADLAPRPDLEVRYYVLDASSPSEEGMGASTEEGMGASEGLQVHVQAQLAPYLARETITVRRERNAILLDERHRWAEPLRVGLSRALADELEGRSGIALAGALVVEQDALLRIDVRRFDGEATTDGRLSAAVVEIGWLLLHPPQSSEENVVARGVFRARRDVEAGGDGYAALAAALSALLGELADDVAAALDAGG